MLQCIIDSTDCWALEVGVCEMICDYAKLEVVKCDHLIGDIQFIDGGNSIDVRGPHGDIPHVAISRYRPRDTVFYGKWILVVRDAIELYRFDGCAIIYVRTYELGDGYIGTTMFDDHFDVTYIYHRMRGGYNSSGMTRMPAEDSKRMYFNRVSNAGGGTNCRCIGQTTIGMCRLFYEGKTLWRGVMKCGSEPYVQVAHAANGVMYVMLANETTRIMKFVNGVMTHDNEYDINIYSGFMRYCGSCIQLRSFDKTVCVPAF